MLQEQEEVEAGHRRKGKRCKRKSECVKKKGLFLLGQTVTQVANDSRS